MFKVLVLAMLSSASGWGLPNDSLLEPNEATSISRRRTRLAAASVAAVATGVTGGGFFCDRGGDEGCDGVDGFGWGGCDEGCDRNCDGCQMAAGCQEQIATTSGLSLAAPRLCPLPSALA